MTDFDEKEVRSWAAKANWFMFQLVHNKSDGFCADDFYDSCRAAKMPPALIKRFAGKLFREFQSARYIVKTDKYRLSRRGQSTPLPIWCKASEKQIGEMVCDIAETPAKAVISHHGDAEKLISQEAKSILSGGEI